jgi:hypothetical protein
MGESKRDSLDELSACNGDLLALLDDCAPKRLLASLFGMVYMSALMPPKRRKTAGQADHALPSAARKAPAVA